MIDFFMTMFFDNNKLNVEFDSNNVPILFEVLLPHGRGSFFSLKSGVFWTGRFPGNSFSTIAAPYTLNINGEIR